MKKYAVTGEKKEILDKYLDAKFEYSAACRRMTQLRLAAESPKATDGEIAEYMRARKVHSEECKAYHKARAEFMSSMVKLQREHNTRISDERALMVYEDLSTKEIIEARKRVAMEEEVNEKLASGEFMEDFQRELDKLRGTTKQQFTESASSSTEDFTEGFDSPFEQGE